jgi:hypothetical protein
LRLAHLRQDLIDVWIGVGIEIDGRNLDGVHGIQFHRLTQRSHSALLPSDMNYIGQPGNLQ